MRLVHAEIELINLIDLELAKRNIIGDDEVKRITLNMHADSAAYMMSINENIQAYLQLPSKGKRKAELANGTIEEYDVVGPIEVRFMNMTATCNAFVLKGDAEPLLGAIPMKEMDVLIHPQHSNLLPIPSIHIMRF